jgi:transposase
VSKKTCSRCGLEKPLGHFYRQEGGAQGRRGVCKECFKAAQRVLWAKNPKIQARRREIVERWRNEGLGV